METREQEALLSWSTAHINPVTKGNYKAQSLILSLLQWYPAQYYFLGILQCTLGREEVMPYSTTLAKKRKEKKETQTLSSHNSAFRR